MKRVSFLGLCLLAGVAASAQTSLVKDVEREMKSSIDKYPTHIEKLKPAFTDPETADGAYVWFVAGKGGMDFFDNQQGLKSIGKEVKDQVMGHALIDSYGYLRNALQRDTVVDAKGKSKTKYSKDIVKLINSHYGDFNNAAIYLWGVQDYDGAYEAWELYATIPSDPILGANAPKMMADSTMSDIYYNQALAAWQANRLQDALNSFDKSMALGYDKKNIFDYAISVAYGLGDNAKMADYAKKAYPLYGKEDSHYIRYIINEKLQKQEYDAAKTLLEQYIAADPNDNQLYYVLGVVYEETKDFDSAINSFKKAVELNADDAVSLLEIGRLLCNEAYTISDNATGATATEYNRIRAEQIDPLFKEAVVYLEKAYSIDPENTHDALSLLRNAYYNLSDEENLKRIEALQ